MPYARRSGGYRSRRSFKRPTYYRPRFNNYSRRPTRSYGGYPRLGKKYYAKAMKSKCSSLLSRQKHYKYVNTPANPGLQMIFPKAGYVMGVNVDGTKVTRRFFKFEKLQANRGKFKLLVDSKGQTIAGS